MLSASEPKISALTTPAFLSQETPRTRQLQQRVLAGLVLGKPIGILAATWIITKATPARLDDEISWWDLPGIGLLRASASQWPS